MNIKKFIVGPLKENCYYLTKEKDLIIVDPGYDFNKLNKIIKNNNFNLLGILITHAHFDHIGALEDLIKEYKVPVYYNNVNNEIAYDKLINIEEKEYNINDFNFKVIYAPGHRNDLSIFYFYEDKAMFTGDFLFKDSMGRVDLEYSNPIQMKQSIEKIKSYSDITIYPGHGEDTTIDYEKENNFYFN